MKWKPSDSNSFFSSGTKFTNRQEFVITKKQNIRLTKENSRQFLHAEQMMQMCVCIWTFYPYEVDVCVCLRSLLNSSVEHAMRITVTCVHAMVQTIEFGVFIFLITVHGNQTVMLSSVVQRKTELRNIIIIIIISERMSIASYAVYESCSLTPCAQCVSKWVDVWLSLFAVVFVVVFVILLY